MCFFLKKKKKTKERRCNEYALCSIHEPPSAHVRGLGQSAILLYSFSLMVCSQLVTPSLSIDSPTNNIHHLTDIDADINMPFDNNFAYYTPHDFDNNFHISQCFSNNQSFL